ETTAVAVGDKVYVIGGDVGSTNDRKVEQYDTVSGTWRSMADLPEPLDHLQLAVVDGLIYAFGGIQAYPGPTNADVYRFDPAAGPAGAWTHIGTMPEPVGGAA